MTYTKSTQAARRPVPPCKRLTSSQAAEIRAMIARLRAELRAELDDITTRVAAAEARSARLPNAA